MASTAQEKSTKFDVRDARHMHAPVRYTTIWAVTLLVCDIVMFVVAAYLAGSLVDRSWYGQGAAVRFFHSSFIFIAVWAAMFYVLGLYERSLALSFKDEFYFTVVALLFGVVPQLLVFTIVPSWSTSRVALLLSAGIAMVFVGASRATIHLVRGATQKRLPSRVLIVGNTVQARAVSENITRAASGDIVTLACDVDSSDAQAYDDAVDAARSLFEAAAKLRCDKVIFTDLQDNQKMRQFLALCEASEIKVGLALPSTPVGTYGLAVERVGNQDLLTPIRPRIRQPTARLTKRVFDMAFASVAVLVSLPVMLVAALAVWMDSGNPIFFRQERVGTFGRIFNVIKFRTMKLNRDSAWTSPGDPRITRVGVLLRRMSIDELPQLFNVLRGDMSLVGPRPEMRAFEAAFASSIPYYVERRLTKPGITGWAQINMKRNLSPEDVEQVLSLDLFYIRNWSFFLDLTVILKTAAEFLFHQGV